ncbi:Chloroperoxidase [Dactylella cylindrospora]|nr:Chloroperoxidase [Dactylella cylindrospora]
MYLTVTNIVKSATDFNIPKPPISTGEEGEEDHTYIRGETSCRSPCPGLNALANQGYLPRDGKNYTIPMVHTALMKTLHMTPTAAWALTTALKPLLRPDGTFDLVDTRRHNVIEHDASFTRLDFHQGDNYTVQPHMVQGILDDAEGGDVTLRTLAKTFVRRNKESKKEGAPGLGLGLWFVSVLQAVGVMNTAQTGGKMTEEVIRAVYEEERFPAVILENPKKRTVFTLLGNAIGMLFWVIVGP